jgi:6-phosphogluconolactonase
MTPRISDAMVARLRSIVDADTVARQAAVSIEDTLRSAIDDKGWGVLAVSGGRSPVRTFDYLTTIDLDWSSVCITLVDERWVEPYSPDSNERLVRSHLLRGDVRPARFVPMKTTAMSPLAGMGRQLSAFRTLPGPIDAVILGMGEDGHFASLFPASSALRVGLDVASDSSCVAVDPGVGGAAPAQPRMSLTLSTISRAKLIVLLTQGAVKRRVLHKAIDTVCNPYQLPIAALLACRPDTVILHTEP